MSKTLIVFGQYQNNLCSLKFIRVRTYVRTYCYLSIHHSITLKNQAYFLFVQAESIIRYNTKHIKNKFHYF